MGLDTVELVMELEKEFAIRIADRDAERLQTVGQIIRYVQDAVRDTLRPGCRSQEAFHALRRGLIGALAVPRERVRLDASLVALAGDGRSLHQSWSAIEGISGRALPRLGNRFTRRAGTIAPIWLFFAFVASVALGATFHTALGVLAFLMLAYLYLVTIGPADATPPDATVRELVRSVTGRFEVKGDPIALSADEQIALRVRTIIAEQMGLKTEDVRDHHDIVRDLGMG